MAKKISAENLGAAIDEILTEYADGLQVDLVEVTNKVAQTGVKALRSASRANFGGTGKYASGWSVEKAKSGKQIVAEATIYNKLPGLPHLLENGHAKRGGGRVAGKAHIAPIEEELVEAYTKAVEEAARR